MDRDCLEAEIAEHEGEPESVGASVDEYDGVIACELVQYIGEVSVFVFSGEEAELLNESFDGLVLGADLYFDGVFETGSLELADLVGHGGREEVGAAVFVDDVENGVDFLLEVHVEQLVGLVEHQILYLLQVETLRVLKMVQHSSRSADHHMRLLAQRSHLTLRVQSAHDHHALQVYATPQSLELLANLDAQFSGRAQHQREKLTCLLQ